jgi:hypothetical protein
VSIIALAKGFPKSQAQLLVAAAAFIFTASMVFAEEEEATHSLRFLRAPSNRCK